MRYFPRLEILFAAIIALSALSIALNLGSRALAQGDELSASQTSVAPDAPIGGDEAPIEKPAEEIPAQANEGGSGVMAPQFQSNDATGEEPKDLGKDASGSRPAGPEVVDGNGQNQARPSSDVDCDGRSVCRVVATGLPLRLMPRPFSNIYEAPEADSAVVRENVRAFFPILAFERNVDDVAKVGLDGASGWYRVGVQTKEPIGYMRAADVFEWHSALILTYSHPGIGSRSRAPVLFFDTRKSVLAAATSPSRAQIASEDIQRVSRGDPPPDIVSIEPDRFVDASKRFYILPVLEHEAIDIYDDPTRLLKVAAAVPNERAAPGAAGSSNLAEFAKEAKEVEGTAEGLVKRHSPSGSSTAGLKLDIVFVMDMTGSMQPYIDQTKEVLSAVIRSVTAKTGGLDDVVRFGLVGYRDDPARTPALQWRTKNFTPSQLVSGIDMVSILGTEAKAAPVTPDEWAEDVYAGVAEAMNEPWREGALRLIVLVGDASSHPSTDPLNSTRQDPETLRAALTDRDIYLFGIYLKNPLHSQDHEFGTRQFARLGMNEGMGRPASYAVDVSNKTDFIQVVNLMTRASMVFLETIISGTSPDNKTGNPNDASQVTEEPVEPSPADSVQDVTNEMLEAALVKYVGREGRPPKDITGWVVDRDLTDLSKRSFDVQILLSRRDLDSFMRALTLVRQAVIEADATQESFFKTLQALVAQSAIQNGEIDFSRAKALKDTRLLPRWIDSLPYKSQILAMSDDMFQSLPAADRQQLESRLESLLAYYQKVYTSPGQWQTLAEGDAAIDQVTPIKLDFLP
ncbi:vWA domain-containing protein [Mesorhizobium helmanticense]|uniref:VWFA domain-containing protein n=1 Tax=Mesorhizobium helmanticense TaxID=1776423 RepID=A0A2T4J3A3_9HYPH|nr:vWA domain-containing protein [Mesorhizobium helmanticense]PTE12384.1 hypothetical protein C9427_02030 [Mesorhizobium helmanticense]